MRAVTASRRLGFDTASYVYPRLGCVLKTFGYDFAVRYIRRDKHVNDEPDDSGDWLISLSKKELHDLLYICDLDVSPVQIAKLTFDADNIARAGDAAGYNCDKLDLPKGIIVWLDAEWQNPPHVDTQADAINRWCDGVEKYGYSPGIYVGPGCTLSSDQLYYELGVKHYWKSASIVNWPSHRGYQMIQGTPLNVMGTDIDQDLVCIDNRGDRFKLVSK